MINTVIVSILGSGGVVGIFFFILRYYIQKQLDKSEQKRREYQADQIAEFEINEKIQHAYSRMFFWIHKAIVTGKHNGDLENAFKKLQDAEEEKKDLERLKLAKMNRLNRDD